MELVARRRIGRAFLVPLVALVLIIGLALYNQIASGTPWRATGAPPSAPAPLRKLTLGDMMLAASTAQGIHLEFDGVTGPPSTVHTNHAAISSFQWGVGVPVSSSSGGTTVGKPSLSEISLSKVLDKFSVPLLSKTFRTTTTPGAVLYFTGVNTSGVATDYLEIDLRNVIVTGLSMSSGGDNPSESLSLHYTMITFKAHIPGAIAQTLTYDIAANKTT
jgi:type VI secretion system secreted protein Hcp